MGDEMAAFYSKTEVLQPYLHAVRTSRTLLWAPELLFEVLTSNAVVQAKQTPWDP